MPAGPMQRRLMALVGVWLLVAMAPCTNAQGAECPEGTLAWPPGSARCWRVDGDGGASLGANGALALNATVEAMLERSLGYGDYVVVTRSDPATVKQGLAASLLVSGSDGRGAGVQLGALGGGDSGRFFADQLEGGAAARQFALAGRGLTYRLRWAAAAEGAPGAQLTFETFADDGRLLQSFSSGGGLVAGDEHVRLMFGPAAAGAARHRRGQGRFVLDCFAHCPLDAVDTGGCSSPLGQKPPCNAASGEQGAEQLAAGGSFAAAAGSCATGYTHHGGSCGGARGRCCPGTQCCSKFGFCGNTATHCGSGCQAAYGTCSGAPAPSPAPKASPSPPPPAPSPSPSPAPLTGRCAAGYTQQGGGCGGAQGLCCPGTQCCSQFGFCGNTATHCGSGCQAAYGSCSGAPAPSPSPAPPPAPSSPAPVPRPSPSPGPAPPPPTGSLLPSGPLMVGYYQTWTAPYSGTAAGHDLARIPAYVNVVMLSFAKPDCTYAKGSLSFSGTGLDFSSPGQVVKDAVALLKATNPNTRVLLAVGGATYTNFAGLNMQCIKDIVTDFGLHGVDLDYEPANSNCQVGSSGVRCATDAESVDVAAKLRAALPKGQYLLSTASWHVGMYGEGAFVNAQPRSGYTGVNLAMAKSAAGQQLDLISIMAYDAGNVQSTGFDWAESYRAHRAIWKTQAVAIGIEIPPEAWGGNAIQLPEVAQRASYAQQLAGSAQYGAMLWSLHKQGCPAAQQITSSVCTTYGLGGCSAALPFPQSTCGGGTAPPPPIPSPLPAPPPSGGGGGSGGGSGGSVLYRGGGSATYYYGWTQTCNGETYAENNGYPSCASFAPGPNQLTLRQLGSESVVAIDNTVLDGNRARYCGKKVNVYKNGVKVSAPGGGDFFVWDGCAACAGGGIVDLSVPGVLKVDANACALGKVPGVTYEVVDVQVRRFVP